MQPFNKVNDLIDNCPEKDKLSTVSIIFNKDRVKSCKYGKYCDPILVRYKYDDGETTRVENPDYMLKIPSTQEDCIQVLGTEYTVLIANAKSKKNYIGSDKLQHDFYECSVGVIRNPVIIQKCKDIELKSYEVTEFEF